MSKRKKLPEFANETEERKFWEAHDSVDYIDWSTAKRVRFPQLKPSTKSISIRLPESMLEDVKILANKNDVPYQSLIKILIDRSLRTEEDIEHKITVEIIRSTYKLLKKLYSSEKSTQHLTDIEVGLLLQQYRRALRMDKEQFSRKINVKLSDLGAIERGDKSVFGTKLDASIEEIFEEDYRDSA